MTKANVLAFLDAEIARLQRAREILSSSDGTGRSVHRNLNRSLTGGRRRRRHMSAEARRRISEAQKKRWATRKRAGK